VNNAGITVAGPVEFLPIDDIRWQFEVNFLGPIAVTQAFIPLLREAQGRIVNMSSIGGRFSAPYVSAYNASKFAMEAWSDSLRIELTPWNIDVSVVEPGNIKTPIWEKGIKEGLDRRKQLPKEAEDLYGPVLDGLVAYATKQGETGIPAQKVANAVLHALTSDKPKTRYLVGPDAKQQAFIARWLPDRIRDKLVLSQIRRGG
jgi:NAD(P)-dependent dehydrogenase (short-subunit alcohol dehydrogenase family)